MAIFLHLKVKKSCPIFPVYLCPILWEDVNATEVYDELKEDIGKAVTAIISVRPHEHRQGHPYGDYMDNQQKYIHEHWISLGLLSFSGQLEQLAFAVNGRVEPILPTGLRTRQDLVNFQNTFTEQKDNVIASFERVIGNPNLIFLGYPEPITMEEFLQKVFDGINDEANNLDYNLKEFQRL
jgi:hypothetical protein